MLQKEWLALALLLIVAINLLAYLLLHRANQRLRNRQSASSTTPVVALAFVGAAPAVLMSSGRHRMLPQFPLPKTLLVVLAVIYPLILVPALLLHLQS